ncbi:MAG: nitrous oxide reductase family maturation protein NosD [Vicinamibacterales bacterium]|jgi:nitrous oxidase accessory protein|nr:nitrous oxide reductase family maturation protein NosD [Vicinamibacterales bacterium]
MRVAAFLAGMLVAASAAAQDHAVTPGNLEGRPGAESASPLQARLDAAPRGARVLVDAGTYRGDLVIERPVHLVGVGRPVLEGSGSGSVVRIRAADVTIEGFDVDGLGHGDLGRDTSGIHVAAPRATVKDCRVKRALFGVYLREAPGSTVQGTVIEGVPGLEPGEKGSGIHVWNTDGFTLTDNRIYEARDGLYIQSSPHGFVARNVASHVRYGLHYMFSDDNVFEDNRFEYAAAGSAIMYSNRIRFRRNQFLHNRGFASVGLLFKACDDVVAEDNLIADNARGIFLEGSNRDVFRRNIIAESDVAIVLYDSCARIRFEGNSFVANLSPLMLVGRRTDTVVAGNYWSENRELDLDGDGFADRPYRLSSVFDHMRGNLTAADLFAQGLAATALGAAETAFPVLTAITVEDSRPLARPPALPLVPRPERQTRSARLAGLALSLGLVAVGGAAAAAARGSRRR